MRNQILIFYFLSNLSSDGLHVQGSEGLQSTTSFQYYRGYRCEIFCEVPSMRTRSDSDFPIFFPTYYQMSYMFYGAEAFNQPLSFDTAEVTEVRAYLSLFGV